MNREMTEDGNGIIIHTCDGKTVSHIEYYPMTDTATIIFTDGKSLGVDKCNDDFQVD